MRVLVLSVLGALIVGAAAGGLGVALLRPSKAAPTLVVPDVQRLRTGNAIQVLQERGLGPVAVLFRPSSRAAGRVLVQSPPPGTEVTRSSRVTLLVGEK